MEFLQNFEPQITVSSPGRINFIGEHTDYNLGYVLPTAIEKSIIFKLRKNGSDTSCNVYTYGYDDGFTFELNKISKSETEWENYILGVLHEISKLSDRVRGFDCSIKSTLPTGSGLSSSAAMECGLAFAVNELFDLGLSKRTIVALCQRAEHNYVGTQCGIMDQFASVMSKEGHVILLDCKSLKNKYIPIDIHPYKIILLNTKVSHTLASSEYNTRKRECMAGVAIMQKKHPHINSLRDANRSMLEESKTEMDQTVYNRCSFSIDENQRVLNMVDAFNRNDLEKVGTILYEAHEGISKLYEVSCSESDFLVAYAKKNS